MKVRYIGEKYKVVLLKDKVFENRLKNRKRRIEEFEIVEE